MDFSVGAGGMGEVYRARDTRLDRVVALKRLPPAFAADPGRVSRLAREAKTLAQLNHPGICTLHNIVVHDGVTLLVMEYLDGETLAARLRRRRPLTVAVACELAAPIADALSAAHKLGIVHRDLKPANIMLSGGGTGRSAVSQVKLVDFGLAKLQRQKPPGGDNHGVTGPVSRGREYGARHRNQHAALHGARATRGEAGGRANRHLGAGRGPLRDARPACAVRRRLFRLPDESDSRERAAARVGRAAVGHSRARAPCPFSRCLAKDPAELWQAASDVAAELRWLALSTANNGKREPATTVPRRSRRRTVAAVVALAAVADRKRRGGRILPCWQGGWRADAAGVFRASRTGEGGSARRGSRPTGGRCVVQRSVGEVGPARCSGRPA